MRKRVKMMIGVGVVLSVLGTLILIGMNNATAFYMTVDEMVGKQNDDINKPAKVSGKIVGESVKWDADSLLLSFELEGENGLRVPFQYKGVKPDTMNDGWEAIADGQLQSDGTFAVSELLVKCPSKYEAMEQYEEYPIVNQS